MRLAVLCLSVVFIFPSVSRAQAPVYIISPGQSSIRFNVETSVPLVGNFDKWDATLTFESSDVRTGILEVKIQAASVNTGSGMKNDKLKGKDFFDVEQNPLVTFLSKTMVQAGPHSFEAHGDLTIRGVSKPATLVLIVSGDGTGSCAIKGRMAFLRSEYGGNGEFPFSKISNRVEVTVDLKGKRVSGPRLVFKK